MFPTADVLISIFFAALLTYAVSALAVNRVKSKHKRQLLSAQARWEREEAELRLGRGPPRERGRLIPETASENNPRPGHGSNHTHTRSSSIAAAGGFGGGMAGSSNSNSNAPIMMESFTLGWLNMLVQSAWGPLLERFVSGITSEKLQLILNEVLHKFSDKRPWKYIDAVAVESVTLGLAPPQFQFANAKFDPVRQQLQIQLNMRFNSSGLQAVLTPRMGQIGALKPFKFRLEITHLLLAGRLNLGIQLSQEAPGIKGVEYSFLQEPEFEIQASPLGLSGFAGELPGLINTLRNALLKAMSKKIVEPNRRYFDVQKVYLNKFVAKSGGPGGLLTVVIVGARDVATKSKVSSTPRKRNGTTGGTKPVAGSTADEEAVPAGHGRNGKSAGGVVSRGDEDNTLASVDPFVEMRFGREVHRTPFIHSNASSPVWNWPFHARLAGDIPGDKDSSEGRQSSVFVLKDDVLRFSVLNAMTIGEPEILCSCKVRLQDLGLKLNGEALPFLLPLQSSSGRSQGSLQIQVKWTKNVPKPKPFTDVVEVPVAPAIAGDYYHARHQSVTDSSNTSAPISLQKPPTSSSSRTATANSSNIGRSKETLPPKAPSRHQQQHQDSLQAHDSMGREDRRGAAAAAGMDEGAANSASFISECSSPIHTRDPQSIHTRHMRDHSNHAVDMTASASASPTRWVRKSTSMPPAREEGVPGAQQQRSASHWMESVLYRLLPQMFQITTGGVPSTGVDGSECTSAASLRPSPVISVVMGVSPADSMNQLTAPTKDSFKSDGSLKDFMSISESVQKEDNHIQHASTGDSGVEQLSRNLGKRVGTAGLGTASRWPFLLSRHKRASSEFPPTLLHSSTNLDQASKDLKLTAEEKAIEDPKRYIHGGGMNDIEQPSNTTSSAGRGTREMWPSVFMPTTVSVIQEESKSGEGSPALASLAEGIALGPEHNKSPAGIWRATKSLSSTPQSSPSHATVAQPQDLRSEFKGLISLHSDPTSSLLQLPPLTQGRGMDHMSDQLGRVEVLGTQKYAMAPASPTRSGPVKGAAAAAAGTAPDSLGILTDASLHTSTRSHRESTGMGGYVRSNSLSNIPVSSNRKEQLLCHAFMDEAGDRVYHAVQSMGGQRPVLQDHKRCDEVLPGPEITKVLTLPSGHQHMQCDSAGSGSSLGFMVDPGNGLPGDPTLVYNPIGLGSAGSLGFGAYDPFQGLAQVVRMKAALEAERAAARNAEARLEEMQRRYRAVARLRQLDNRRALTEGARFILHAPFWPQPRTVVVRYMEDSQAVQILSVEDSMSLLGGRPTKSPLVIASFQAAVMKRVELGSSLFPDTAALLNASIAAGVGKSTKLVSRLSVFMNSKGGGEDRRHEGEESVDLGCFSIILDAALGSKESAADLAAISGTKKVRKRGQSGAGVVMRSKGGSDGADFDGQLQFFDKIHLQVPLPGNGRSRDEWAHGFMDLIHQ
ncbi:hypothetical protein CEUSTIGMA_g9198.t1 [Chlamydomonas eustigma]|uniref:SMP-LTD domain-containing protein n=1 Tax=Chlamydomonas eustigma TaxID=1157962 RepID=A0A250XG56_9CHLO|nr:hypothetical protein CEUSTIGMA_g9198.t1 [Chlamydomonas eustigma]|eukprot:GAX81770.1 hypothetical protein CEUSTIGMA_g9198.t1 [Chlamydomonas eustigma]